MQWDLSERSCQPQAHTTTSADRLGVINAQAEGRGERGLSKADGDTASALWSSAGRSVRAQNASRNVCKREVLSVNDENNSSGKLGPTLIKRKSVCRLWRQAGVKAWRLNPITESSVPNKTSDLKVRNRKEDGVTSFSCSCKVNCSA